MRSWCLVLLACWAAYFKYSSIFLFRKVYTLTTILNMARYYIFALLYYSNSKVLLSTYIHCFDTSKLSSNKRWLVIDWESVCDDIHHGIMTGWLEKRCIYSHPTLPVWPVRMSLKMIWIILLHSDQQVNAILTQTQMMMDEPWVSGKIVEHDENSRYIGWMLNHNEHLACKCICPNNRSCNRDTSRVRAK